jgi:transcriptional regulator with XRE-family HTH domain
MPNPHSYEVHEYRYIQAKQLENAQQFGHMLRRWRESNNWTQYTCYRWGKAAGFETMAPSTLSVLENGKAPKPRPESFFALAEVNRRLAVKDFTGAPDDLKDLISQALPLVNDEGKLFGPQDFWSCHLGLIAVPAAYQASSPAVTEAGEAIATIVEAFQAAQLDPKQAAKIQEIAAQLKAIRDQ